MNSAPQKSAFTLLEILLVVAAIGILAAIVIVAINPNEQLAKVRDSERQSEVGTLYDAIQQYNIDNDGEWPDEIASMSANSAEEICADGVSDSSCINLTDDLTPAYVAAIPEDPQSDGTGSQYVVIKDDANRIKVEAIATEEKRQIIAAGDANIPVLDRVPGAAAAYSVRRLRVDYTDPTMTIRKSTGNTTDPTQDIGFDNEGELDTQALNNFCGTNECYVQTWHDQSGNNRDVTQNINSEQPQIYDGNSVITRNGQPAVNFDGTDDELITANDATWLGNTAYSFFGVVEGNANRYWVGQEDSGDSTDNDLLHLGHRDSDTLTVAHRKDDANFSYTGDSNQHLHAGTFYNSGSDYYIDGRSQGTSDTRPQNPLPGDNKFTMGGAGVNDNIHWAGTISEGIFYASDESGVRSAIEDNINGYYGIY